VAVLLTVCVGCEGWDIVDVLLTVCGGWTVLLTGGGSLCAKILPIIHKKTMKKIILPKTDLVFE